MKRMYIKKPFFKNPFVLFLPFLIFYTIVVIIFPTNGNYGDESRYLIYAQYMVNGFISEAETGFNILGNGPGYSLILIPFVALKIPLITITLFNAVLYYFSAVIVFQLLISFLKFNYAFLITLFWALYPNMYEIIIYISPDTFTVFLICLIIFSLKKLFVYEGNLFKNKYIYISAVLLSFLTLTKPIFGYVLLTMLVGSFFIYLSNKKNYSNNKSLFILVLSIVFTLPYLGYTYKHTGKYFYWSNVGGNNLYWMSTPFEHEYGDWFLDPDLKTNYSYLNHRKDFEEINKYEGVERDDAYKAIAIKNIRSHPRKFLINCVSNLGRMFFNFPYSYSPQKPGTLLRLPMTGILVVLFFFSVYPALRNWKKIPFYLRFMLLFTLIYLGGSIFGSAEIRMSAIIVPCLTIWVSYIFKKTIKINPEWPSN